jgi:SPP1 gp7 family putative phage head morphogenesis protein
MPSVNEVIFDRTVRHSHFLARYSSGEAARITRFLEREVYPDLIDQIQRKIERYRSGATRNLQATVRLRELQANIEKIIREGNAGAYKMLTASLQDAAVAEARFTRNMLNGVLEPFSLSTSMPSVQVLRQIATGSMVRGESIRDEFAAMTARTRRAVVSSINIGLAQGESTQSIVRRVRGSSVNTRGVLAFTRTEATRIVRTSVNHTVTQAREKTYEENNDIVKGVLWVSTLDDRTSPTCIVLDGKEFGLDEGPRPPAHPNCRSSTSPILRSYRELGLDLPDVPRSTRASMDGQVPAATTYPEWLRRQSVATQNEVLGKRLATEWRAGRVPISRFVDQNYRPLSMKDVLRLEGLD